MIRDDSSRNRQDAMRDGRVEPREAEAYSKQYVEVARGEPAQPAVRSQRPVCRSGVSVVAAEAFMNHVGLMLYSPATDKNRRQ